MKKENCKRIVLTVTFNAKYGLANGHYCHQEAIHQQIKQGDATGTSTSQTKASTWCEIVFLRSLNGMEQSNSEEIPAYLDNLRKPNNVFV